MKHLGKCLEGGTLENLEITRTNEIFTIDVKRFGAPFLLKSTCPNCGEISERDYSNRDYFSYPSVGKPEEVGFYCRSCDHEWRFFVVIDLTLTPVRKP